METKRNEERTLVFEQRPGESGKAFAAFSLWMSLPVQERSFQEVARRLQKSCTLVRRWCHRWQWRERLQSFESHMALIEREAAEATVRAKGVEWAKREQDLREEEWDLHTRAIEAAKRGLAAYMERSKVYANLADIARMLEVASKLGRLATGMRMDGQDEKQSGTTVGVRVEVNLALEKVYGQPIAGEVVDVEEVTGDKCQVSGGGQSLLTSAATKEGA